MRRAVLVLLAACGGSSNPTTPDAPPPDAPPDADIVPVFRNPVDLADDVLAEQALVLLGADVPGTRNSCQNCHGMTRQHLAYWRSLHDTAMTACFTDLAVSSPESARTMIECLRSMPEVAGSDFSTKKLGIVSAATDLPWFQYTLRKAYGAEADTEAAKIEGMVAMPRGSEIPRWTQGEFDIVAEWFARGLPQVDSALPDDPPPTECLESVSNRVPQHVAQMATAGWRAINNSNLMPMHGCGDATDPRNCLADVPSGTEKPYGAGWELPGRGKLRLLADVAYSTSFWSRSSPDGRFVGHGVQNVSGSFIFDLQRGTTVGINAAYDPAWFPDNSGFMFQGGPRNTCAQSLLTANPTQITMTEPECSDLTTIGLYQQVGMAIGGDYFAVESRFVSDDGGHGPTHRDPAARFTTSGYLGFIPMIFNGTSYQARAQVTVPARFEGDAVLSPSAKLVMTRVAGPDDQQLGYVLREVNATMTGNSYAITAPEVARYCVSGGKISFSYDERWVVYHHYVTSADAVALGFTGANDPAFQPYLQSGAANVYLLELATGQIVRITNMNPGQYALFPNFRSDGWIYIQVRDINTGREYIVASDAALVAE